MATRVLAIVLALSSWGACTHDPPAAGWKVTTNPKTGAPYVPVNEGALVSALIGAYFAAEPTKTQGSDGRDTVLLRAETIPITRKKSLTFPQNIKTLHQVLAAVPEPVFASFTAVNKHGYVYKPSLPPPTERLRLALIAGDRAQALLGGDEDGWQAVLKKYPKAFALVSASRPGIDAKGAKALLYITAITGDEVAAGVLLYGKRDGETWKLVQKAKIWSSE